MEALLSHKLLDHGYEQHNSFRLKEDNPAEKLQDQLSHPSFSHIKQKCHEFDSRKDSHSNKI